MEVPSAGVVYSPLPCGIRIPTYWYGFGGGPFRGIRYPTTAYRYCVNRNSGSPARSTVDSHGSSLYLGIGQDDKANKTLANLILQHQTRNRIERPVIWSFPLPEES